MPWLIVALVAASNLLSAEAWGEKRIGILLFSEETRYQESAKGVMDQLKKEGFGDPAVRFTIENAGRNKAKTAELAKKFAAAKLDLIFTMGTSATQATVREIRDVPVVFSMVYDPVEAKIARDWKSSGNNTTGTSPRVPMARLMDCLRGVTPVKSLAVLYTPGEKNSETQLRDLLGIQATYKIKIVPVPLTRKEDVSQILPDVIRTTDALYVTGSNLVDSEIATIVDIATRARAVTISHLEDLVGKGVLLGVCANPYLTGRLAGEKGVKILKGAKPSAIPIETLKKPDVILNMKTARKGQYQIPPSFMKSVTKTIE
jgi:putative ABC transport system substrate-binding protein